MKRGHGVGASLRDAWRGIISGLLRERNLRLHVLALTGAVVIGILIGLSPLEWVVLLAVSALVLGFELVNSAIEVLLDLIEPGQNELVALAKDMAAGAVLVSALLALSFFVLVMLPRLCRN